MSERRDAVYVVTFGLALVLAMAAVLFALVGLNPKGDQYGIMPWVYSGASALGAAVFWRVSGRLAPPPTSP